MECSICGISGKLRHVSEALSSKGVIFACTNCISEEGLIPLKKPKKIEEDFRGKSVYERLTRISGVDLDKKELREDGQDRSLKEITDKNYEEKMKKEELRLKPRSDLVEDFQWILMRVRRIKGLTQKQLAERIGEPEAAIRMAEQGIVPDTDYKLLDKLEDFLKVRLIKEKDKEILRKSSRGFIFDSGKLSNLTIADLQRMKEERERNRPGVANLKEEGEKKKEE